MICLFQKNIKTKYKGRNNMCETLGIGPDYQENWEEMSAITNTSLRVFADALDLLDCDDNLTSFLHQDKHRHLWSNCLNPFFSLLNELLFTATNGKEGCEGLAHKSLSTYAPRWQLQLARNFFRQVKNPVPNNIKDFLRQARRIAHMLWATRSVEIADKETYETIVAFLKIAGRYKH